MTPNNWSRFYMCTRGSLNRTELDFCALFVTSNVESCCWSLLLACFERVSVNRKQTRTKRQQGITFFFGLEHMMPTTGVKATIIVKSGSTLRRNSVYSPLVKSKPDVWFIHMQVKSSKIYELWQLWQVCCKSDPQKNMNLMKITIRQLLKKWFEANCCYCNS